MLLYESWEDFVFPKKLPRSRPLAPLERMGSSRGKVHRFFGMERFFQIEVRLRPFQRRSRQEFEAQRVAFVKKKTREVEVLMQDDSTRCSKLSIEESKESAMETPGSMDALREVGFCSSYVKVIRAYQPWWRDSRLQLWGLTALMLVLLFVGSCLASFSNRGSLRKTHSCYVEWWHLIEKCENSMFLAICFDKQILLFWTNIPKLLCAASFHPSHQVFFWMELLLQWPTKNRSSPCNVSNMFPGFFLIK